MSEFSVTEPLERQQLRHHIEKAVRRGDHADVLARLAATDSLPGLARTEPLGLEVLRLGFGGGMTNADRVSFASYCIRYRKVQVLEAVLRSDLAPRQTLLTKVTGWHTTISQKRNGRTGAAARGLKSRSESLLETAASNSDANTMRLAHEFEGHTTRLREPLKRNPLAGARTAHADALDLAMSALRNPGFEGAVEVCKVFVEARLPATDAASSNFVLEKFTGIGGQSVDRAIMREMFELYQAGGYLVDIDTPLNNFGVCPLARAIALDNRETVLGLIRLGANLERAAEDLAMPGEDILAVLADQAHRGSGEFIAEVAQFLMERQLATRPAPQPESASQLRDSRRHSLRV